MCVCVNVYIEGLLVELIMSFFNFWEKCILHLNLLLKEPLFHGIKTFY